MIYYSPVANVVVLVVLLAAMIEVDLHYVYYYKDRGKDGEIGGLGKRELGQGSGGRDKGSKVWGRGKINIKMRGRLRRFIGD